MNQAPRQTPASNIQRGWHWFTRALGMLRANPAPFLLMGLTMACIRDFPFLGGLAMLIFGPALIAGTCRAAHEATAGRTPPWSRLFAMFQHPHDGEAIKLCLPLVAGKIIAALVLAFGLVSHMTQQSMDIASLEKNHQLWTALLNQMRSPAMLPWWIAALAIMLFSWTLVALAIPRVAFSTSSAFAAIAWSFRLVWQHIVAWITAALALFVCLTVLTGLLYLTGIGIIVQLGLMTALYTVLGPLLYCAWRDLDGNVGTRDEQPPPPPRSSAPPPPSGVLEA